jgi:hypothetical protein
LDRNAPELQTAFLEAKGGTDKVGEVVKSWGGEVLALRQSFPCPTWVPTAIKNGEDHNHIINDAVIYRKREPIGVLAVVSKNNLVNTSKVSQ